MSPASEMLCEVDELNKAFKVKFGNTVRLEIHSPRDVFPEDQVVW